MVTIRLTRRGANNQPFYHVVVTDSRVRQGGSSLELVGYFNPVARGKDTSSSSISSASITGSRVAQSSRTGCECWSLDIASKPRRRPPSLNRYLVLGRVVAPFGVRGWVRVQSYTDPPDSLLQYRRLATARTRRKGGRGHTAACAAVAMGRSCTARGVRRHRRSRCGREVAGVGDFDRARGAAASGAARVLPGRPAGIHGAERRGRAAGLAAALSVDAGVHR